jgi:hypothetical protein
MARVKRGAAYVWAVRAVDLLAHWFPGIMVTCMLIFMYQLLAHRSLPLFLLALVFPYLVPLLLFRMLHCSSVLAKDVWSMWFVSYRLQLIYGYFPFLENALLAVPGLFNFWLRAWGSRLGKRVFWAATVQVADRSHLEIGDNVMIGNAVFFSCHVMQRRRNRGVLYFKRIKIGDGAFIGSGSRIGPGVVVEPGALVPLLTDLYVKQRFAAPRPTAPR